ncbi:signal transduction histidine kinase [Microcella putealis]|uniref:Signal transduction histidine kinase n=1 Tax=Microcella putealis TaxID=337005 RepID=A0A4Q7LZ38_9MICO|nr:ATP-binding protein [Microcella putealis]RZS59209.1 signal transduction histidine kinase [Microcella putealis]TQM24235.1 signal transduction histidine kinase [Microcella putealis]
MIERERRSLLQRSARAIGLGGLIISAVCLSLPGIVEPDLLPSVLILLAGQAGALIMVGRSEHVGWPVLTIVLGLAALTVAQLPFSGGQSVALPVALAPLGAVGIGAVGIVLSESRPRWLLWAFGTLASAFLVALAGPTMGLFSTAAIATLAGWAITMIIGIWVTVGVERSLVRIDGIGRAHQVERQASEMEAQRRQSARLLHDTVLATLTLLAHSGVGVSADALRQQATEDARLLRQLRLGSTPMPRFSGSYNLEPVSESTLGTTLESVKQRFLRMGLEVRWHGTGQVLLRSDVLDAFLFALAECLENVRRHAGVSDADVTITESEDTLRAVVTDAGRGFAPDEVEDGRLGVAESVIARLRDVGGNARLFSTPGAGTTVILEVPR